MSKTITVLCACAILLAARESRAQYVREQTKLVGPIVALNLQGDPTFFFGLNFEYMVKRDVGVGGIFRYFTYVAKSYPDGGSYVFSGEVVGAQANYHFKVPQNELDPFVGAMFGYAFTSGGYKNTTATYGNPPASPPNLVFCIMAGARYFLTDKVSAVGRLCFGANYNTLEVGGDISL